MIKWTREEVAELLGDIVVYDDKQNHYQVDESQIKYAHAGVNEELDGIASHLNAYGVTTPTLIARLDRFEAKLDTLIEAFANDDDKPAYSLDGDPLPQDRREGDEL